MKSTWFKGSLVFSAVFLLIYYIVGTSDKPVAELLPTVALYGPEKTSKHRLDNALSQWQNNDYQQAVKTLASIDPIHQPSVTILQLYTQMYLANKNESVLLQHWNLAENCRQKILFVTADIDSLAQTENFRASFAQDKRLQSLSICIHNVTWFDPTSIACEENWQQQGRLGCDVLTLAEKLKSLPFTHLVMFADKGKANVKNGIMFLDKQDTYDVFVHELAHFSGFIDEYPLSAQMAKRVCAGVDAPNMVFRQQGQQQAERQYWQTLNLSDTQESIARTCNNHSTQAYKASSDLTFMEFHDTANIPRHYLLAWQRQLQQSPKHPSAHVNFAQLYEQSNNLAESQFWRGRYQQYLSKP